jgi:signal transduction histidine kinase
MFVMVTTSSITETVHPEHLYRISQVIARASQWKPALDEIAGLVRSIFIFDNLAVYLTDQSGKSLEVMYARAVGRGRAKEADIAWGERAASQIIEGGKMMLQEPQDDSSVDRIQRPYLLGFPLLVSDNMLGSIVFVRFGGPTFQPDHIRLAEFIANQIALLVERQNLVHAYEILKDRNREFQFQEDFISTITHELRSPLGFIKGYTTTLLRADTTWDQDTQEEFLQIIDQETDNLQELIGNLLDSARLQSGQLDMRFQPVRLDALMNDVVMRAQVSHPNLEIHLDVSRDLPSVRGSPQRLSQVFQNLLSNATKYAPDSPVAIQIKEAGEQVLITVRDHGPGIGEEYIPSLFTRFFRNPDQPTSVRGTGLGLYICKQIIQAHDGQITVSSKVGEGTVFNITLPVNL